jgi:hypothetical protein
MPVGLENVTATAPPVGNASKFTQAICTDGNVALGGGALTLGAVETTALLQSVESTTGAFGFDAGWAGAARGAAAGWNLTVRGICADPDANPIATASTSSATLTVPDLTHTTACPEGMVAIGGEAQALPINNATGTDDARLTALGPDGPPDAPTGWTATARRPGTNTAEWRLTVGVICVPEPAGAALGAAAASALAAVARRRRAGAQHPTSTT